MTSRSLVVGALLSLVWSALGCSSSGAATPPGQVITVEAATALSQTAVLRTWRETSTGHYVQVFGAMVSFVGVNGVRPTREGLGRTPVGVFTMTEAFGNRPDNGTRLPYIHVGPDDWWDENPASVHYNRMVRSSVSPGGNSENLYYAGAAYAHAVVINYNMSPVVKGAGSGFFLHVSFGAPTEGCVALPESELDRVMRWLNPAVRPVISIGVGQKALALVESGS
jgi:L,D-peptidoglycan transpeptidase YkuD (ErfK/YbiS/YcfS/YnhG family)